ncbi:MAG: RNA polymerase sigma factor [Deltaproteobacteria bacterium]|nr:RNA polymerase sigma factor [Deltaproteobacteria bacterium]
MKRHESPAYCPDIHEHVKKGISPGIVFSEIVTCFGRDLKNFARYRCGTEADADDAYQDALLAAHRYIHGFRGETPLKHWLLKLVSTACLQKKRGRKNDPRLHVTIDAMLHPELEKHLLSHEVPSDAQAMIKERLECLREALGKLAEKDRDMLLLHEGEGKLLSEIAAQFKMTVPGVKTRLFRARAAIKKYVEERQGAMT